ncbi:MAG: GNAT family N-acetyltransferase [Bacteroidota bacterium]|jgi:ElaA protein|nr:GNAT family N-acetyltransferase [Bacteroidota bacterium]
MIKWECQSFNELAGEELYKIIQLRIEVFAVEQNIVYQDCDNKDMYSWHLTGSLNNKIVAYSRIIPPGISYPEAASIGRVVTSPEIRSKSIGKLLFKKSLEELYNLFGDIPVTLSAQLYLVKFYESFSFNQKGSVYIEDNVRHIKMERPRIVPETKQ